MGIRDVYHYRPVCCVPFQHLYSFSAETSNPVNGFVNPADPAGSVDGSPGSPGSPSFLVSILTSPSCLSENLTVPSGYTLCTRDSILSFHILCSRCHCDMQWIITSRVWISAAFCSARVREENEGEAHVIVELSTLATSLGYRSTAVSKYSEA